MIELFLNFGAYFMLAAVAVYFIKSTMSESTSGYLSNDLSRDGTHWSYDEVVVAAYVTVWQDDKLRLDDNYQTFIGSVLKRSDRAVAEQMRRIRSVATPNTIASDFVQNVAFDIASMNENDAENEFMFAIESLGGDLVTLNTFSI
tara:strand:- start:1465 stop:1899 length:435 start_codon:yes stop_codon:yes gene_type:complete